MNFQFLFSNCCVCLHIKIVGLCIFVQSQRNGVIVSLKMQDKNMISKPLQQKGTDTQFLEVSIYYKIIRAELEAGSRSIRASKSFIKLYLIISNYYPEINILLLPFGILLMRTQTFIGETCKQLRIFERLRWQILKFQGVLGMYLLI